MKNIFTLALLLFAMSLFAQPINDDCSGIIDLGVAPICDSTVYTNIDATATDIGNDNIPTNCSEGGDWTFTGRDVWFQFTSSDTILDYTFTVNGVGTDPLNNPQIAIYRGDICGFDEMALFACARAEDGEMTLELDLDGLDFNTPYFIRINDWSPSAAPNSGTFNLCIEEQDPINTIDQGSSTACTGELYDSGGPDENYSPDEDNTFSICPPTPNNGCVTFNLQYFNIGDAGDQLNFYDGPDNNSPQIVSLDGFDFNGDNNGGVCYTVQASSGCLTVELISDGTLEFEGFAASWECSIMPCEPLQPITINDNIDDQNIIDNITTPQTLVTIDTIICEQGAYGTFLAGDDTDLGLGQGLLLTTGSATQVAGPAPGASISNGIGTPGDDDLDYLSDLLGNGSLSNDACIVELDVFVATNELNFEYIFGSEEYPEFVGGQFNDIFAFLISGPNIDGDPNIDNQLNIATLPGTTTPVEINSVNNSVNWQYYRNNEDGQSVAYDGLTSDFLGTKKSLTATASVTPCQTYHLKLAVADRGDNILDSGVFIGELKGGTPNTALNSSLGLEFLVEDCTGTEDEILISLNNPQDEDQTYVVNVGGSATRDVDYILNMPDSITIPSGETQLSFSIIPLSDGIFEGPETITIQLTNDFGCGVVELAVLTINLLDEPAVEINSGVDTVLVCQDSCALLSAFGGATYFWTPPGLFDDDTSPTPIACPDSSQWITVSGSIGALPGCSDVDSVFLQIIDPMMDVVTTDETNICEGDSVQLSAVNNVNDINLTWSPVAGLDDPNSSTPLATPTTTTTYTATVDVFGCLATDQITINVDPFDFPEVTDDMVICQGSVVQLADPLPGSTTQFEWTPADFLDDPNIAGATATLNTTGTIKYVLTATSESGFCSQQDSVEFNVLPAEVSIQEGDTAFICLGDSIRLNAFTSTGGTGLTWFPDDSISNTTDIEVTVFPTVSTWYFASLDVGGCSVLDSIFVRVDSIPDLPIMVDPEKDPYCSGEFVTLSSPIFDPEDYPDIEHLWFPFAGLETDSTFLNMVVMTFDTITYFRATTNNACSDTSEVTLNVLPPIVLEITNDTTVCEGEIVQLNVSSDDPDATFTWMPDAGLSCSDCPDPIATLTDTIDYTVTGEVFGCPAFEDVLINVENEPVLELAPDPTICLGESVMLNTLIDPNATYEWTSTDPNFGTVTDPTPTVSPDSSYTYFVTMSKEACASIQGEVNVNVIINILQIPMDTTVCAGDTIQLDVTSTSSDATYSWLPVAGLSCTDCPTPTTVLSDTIQYIVVVDAEGCVTNTSFMVNVEERPELALPNDTTLCAGEPINLNSANIDPNATYTWTSTNPNFTDLNNPSPTISPDSTYTYSVVLEKDFCTTIEDEVTIGAVINELTVGPDVDACPFDTVQLSVVSTYDDATYTWEPTTNLSCTDCPNPMVFSSDTIQYTINVDADGCLAFAFVSLNTVRMPEVTLPADTSVCLGEPVPLNSINDPAANYSWTSTDPDFTNTTIATPSATPLVDATYNLVVEKNNCTEEHEGNVEVIEPAVLEVDGTMNVCLDDEVELIATAIPASSQDVFSWLPDGASGPINSFTADQLGTFRYFVTLNNTCDVLTDSIDFTVRDVALVTDDSLQFPEELIGANNCYSEGERLTISVNGVSAQDTVRWLQNGTAIGVGPAIEAQVIQSEETFQAVVTTQFGCTTIIEQTICVNEAMIEMPNAFTPDSDGYNDYFAPVTLGLYEMPTTFRIWNRFGQLVYDNGNPDGWDGTHKGRLAPSDVYIYHIIVRDFTGEVFEDSGEVTLVR